MLELFMSFSHRDLSGWRGCGKNQCRARWAESFLRGDERALQQGPGSRWHSKDLRLGEPGLGQDTGGEGTKESGVGLGSSGLHRAGCHAVHSGPSWGKEDGERAEAWRQLSAWETGAELGRSSPAPGQAVHGIQVGSPRGLGGQYIPTAPGGEAGQGASAAPQWGAEDVDSGLWRPRKVVAIKQQSLAFLPLWLAQPLPLVPRWAGVRVWNRGCAFSSFC